MVVKNELEGNIEHTLFDIDGTLTYFEDMNEMLKEALPDMKEDPSSIQKKHMLGVSRLLHKSRINNLYFSIENYAREQQKALEISLKEAYLLVYKLLELTPKYIKGFPNVADTLDLLNYDSIIISDWFLKNQIEKLKKVNIEKKFRAIYTCEGDYAKPNIQRYINVLGNENLDPSKCVMIGDSFTDLGAKNVGIQTILIDYNQNKMSLYKSANAVITEFEELPKILRR